MKTINESVLTIEYSTHNENQMINCLEFSMEFINERRSSPAFDRSLKRVNNEELIKRHSA